MSPSRAAASWTVGLGLGALTLGVIAAVPASAAEDARFFGTYCGDPTFVVRTRVSLFGFIPLGEHREEIPTRFRVTVGHEASARGAGVLTGSGVAEARGERWEFGLSGLVLGRGRAVVTGGSGRALTARGEATLSSDGDRLVVRALGHVVTLGKDSCGNERPTASISAPVAGSAPWGRSVRFVGRGVDPEDGSIPDERLEWRSNRDGVLGHGGTIERRFLSPGEHLVTLTATDSGGRLGVAERRLTITNNPPRVFIDAPSARVFYVGQTIGFRGWAQDRESGDLTGGALRWASSRDGVLGTGRETRVALSQGRHDVTLTATDREGSSARASISLDVRPRPAGNTPPTVVVRSPLQLVAIADTDCVTLLAEASDIEDGPLGDGALVWRDHYDDGAGRPITRELPDRGSVVEVCGFATGSGDTLHRLEVTATDSEGESASDAARVLVIPGGLI